MMPAFSRNYDIVSGATLDGVYFEIPLRRRPLERKLKQLGPFRLALAGREAAPLPSVSCELWRISTGRFIPAGLDQRAWLTRWADAVDGFSSAWLGDDAKLWGPVARSLNDMFCVKPYHELVVGVPDVCFGRDNATSYRLVLGMATDSRLAMSLDWWSRYGYQKQLAEFVFAEPGKFHVEVGSAPLLSGAVARASEQVGDFSWLNARWQQPLLGCVGRNSWSASRLQRAITRETPCYSGTGQVQFHEPATEIALSGLEGLRDRRVGVARVALFTSVPTRISAPIRLEAK